MFNESLTHCEKQLLLDQSEMQGGVGHVVVPCFAPSGVVVSNLLSNLLWGNLVAACSCLMLSVESCPINILYFSLIPQTTCLGITEIVC